MTTEELEVAILENMKDIYKADYIGKLSVSKESSNGYLIKLGLSFPEAPVTIYIETDDDTKLIKFLRKELRDRHLNPQFFGSISLVYPAANNNCIKNKCCDT